MKKKTKAYVLQSDLVIPAGTELKEWKGQFEAVIGIHKDACIYLRGDAYDLDFAPDLFKKAP